MSYDEALLAQAPQATKAQLQGGYNPEILAEKPSIPPIVDPEAANNHVSSSTPFQRPESAKKGVPFYATTKGIVIIVAVFAVVLIAAVVGGVVGSSKNHNSVKNTNSTTGQGVASAPSGSVAASSTTVSQVTISVSASAGPGGQGSNGGQQIGSSSAAPTTSGVP